MTPFEAIRFVGTPIALIAFIVAVGAYVYRSSLLSRRKLLEAAPPDDRARLLEATIRDFSQIQTENLTRDQRYQLALRLIEERAARFRTMALVGVVLSAFLAASVALVTLRFGSAEDADLGLIVRVHGPGGPADLVTSGSVTLDTGDDLDTRPIGPEGEVRFARVDPGSLERASLIANVPGYTAVDGTSLAGAGSGVVYLAVAPEPTAVYGTVLDPGRTPLAGVVLVFDGGTAIDTTDAEGGFRILLPAAPGTRVPVRAVKEGVVGYSDMITIQDGAALTVFFDAPPEG